MKSASSTILRTTAILAFSALATTAYSQVVKKSEAIPTEPAKEQPAKETPVAVTTADDSELIVLSPFEVNTSTDKGYVATETTSGTRLRTELKDVASSISVYTKEFMKDIGATDNGTLLQYTTNTEVAGSRGTYAGVGNGASLDDTSNLRAPGGAQRIRGLAAADTTRDLFITDIPWDSYNSDRIEIQRGPNAILFGLGSPAGIVNSNLRGAEYRNLGSVEVRTGSYGSVRKGIDINRELIPKQLAIRVDGLISNEKYQQKPAYQDTKRIYGALRYEPKWFDSSAYHTVIKVNYEQGDIKANRPRTLPPNDKISPWFREYDPRNVSLQSGLGKYAVTNPYTLTPAILGTTTASTSAPETAQPWLTAPVNQQQAAWFIDGVTNQLYRASAGYIQIGARNNTGGVVNTGMPALRYSSQFYGVNGLYGYATNAKLPGYQYGQYKDESLLDPSIFDFYNKLIDGPTKSEYENWHAYNFDFSQTALNDRIGFDFAFDYQKYGRGGQSVLGWMPTISIDVTQTLQDGSTNPNFGRPYVAANSGSGSSYDSERTYARAQLFGELRATDFIEKGFLTKLLGRHRIQGIASSESYKTDNRSWQMYANSQDWGAFWNGTDGSTSAIDDRGPLAFIYIGPSLKNAASAQNANLSGIKANVTYQDTGINLFDSHWNSSADPTALTYTVPTTGWQSLALNGGTTGIVNQASNPANYVGWNNNFQDHLVRYNNGNDLSLLTGASLAKKSVRSYSGTWQAFMWNDAVVPTLGWRYDSVTTTGVTGRKIGTNRNIIDMNESGPNAYILPDNPGALNANQNYNIASGHSTSGGVVVHLNKLFTRDYLPLNISLSYNKSQNFQVTNTRRDFLGNPIDNPFGKTKEYGVLLSTKDRKYSFRAVKYETSITRADANLDFTGLWNVPNQGIKFRNVFLYKLSNYPYATRETAGDRNFWQTAWVDNTTGRPVAAGSVAAGGAPANSHLQTQVEADAMRDTSIRAWNAIQASLQAKGFYQAWGYTPTTQSALTDRGTLESTAPGGVTAGTQGNVINGGGTYATQYTPDAASVLAYGPVAPQGLSVTTDTVSKGYEFELTANPLPNWRLSFNASKTEAYRNNVGGKIVEDMVNFIDAQMAGAAGDMRQFSGGYSATNEVRQTWANWRGKYTLMKIQEGASAPEIRKWRYNVTTSYSFNKSWLKGLGVGTSYRWQDKVVIGYPTLAIDATKASYDLSKPYYGPAEDALDAWIYYECKLSEKLRWKIQLNGRNLFLRGGKIPITVQPDGYTWAGVRLKPTQEWFLTNTLMF